MTNTKRATVALLFLGYLACVPAATWLVANLAPIQVGFGFLAPAGVLVAGLAFTLRDLLQLLAGKALTIIAIFAGTALAAAVDVRLALASATAFLVSELLDMAVFTPLEKRTLLGAVAASNTAGILVDSVIFLSIAFGSLAFLPGQLLGKGWMILLALLLLAPVRIVRARAA
jgi:uncharacterized PurR-regulated membrane protein YhhQ (DUF165 family)